MPENFDEFLYRNNLLKRGETAIWQPLAGGVSSDIWRVELPTQTICVKRALATLKVAADWHAPTERNNYEWEWFNYVHRNFPENVPRPIAHDREMQILAMEFLAPEEYKNWKSELLEGNADADFAAEVGAALGKIHAAGANDETLKKTFATDDLFYALRIEPYLLATAEKYPAIAAQIRKIADRTFKTKIALVHGDMSPKNILKGKNAPVFLDAETAWFGDPAFDVAFCLNHFLLKSIYLKNASDAFFHLFTKFFNAYLDHANWENPADTEKRTADLLPILFLARVDGKSPVEYLTGEYQKEIIRKTAVKFIANAPMKLNEFIIYVLFQAFH